MRSTQKAAMILIIVGMVFTLSIRLGSSQYNHNSRDCYFVTSSFENGEGKRTMKDCSRLFVIESQAITQEIVPAFGNAPEIDGYIDKEAGEWNHANKTSLLFNSSQSTTDRGLPFQLWVLQNGSNLYISIQYDLEYHDSREFVGILISENTDEMVKDAKIIKFSDPLLTKSEFLDYHVEDGVFQKDTRSNGEGAAKLEDKTVSCEFSVPVNSTEDDLDVILDYGSEHVFKIIYGETSSHSYSSGTKRTCVVQINIQYPPPPQPKPDLEKIFTVLSIIIFIALGTLFGFYVYKIIILKKKTKNLR